MKFQNVKPIKKGEVIRYEGKDYIVTEVKRIDGVYECEAEPKGDQAPVEL